MSPTQSPRARWPDRRRSPTTWQTPMTGARKQANQGKQRLVSWGTSYGEFVLSMPHATSVGLSVVGVILSAWSFAAIPASAQSPTFAKDVAPIFYAKCVECHRPTMFAPMSLIKFEDARPWAKSIRNRVAARTMPPWGADPSHGTFKNDPRLTDKEIDDHPRVGRRRRAEGQREGSAGGADVRRRRLDHRQARRRVRDERRRSRFRPAAPSSISTSASRPASPRTAGCRRSRSSRRRARTCIT